MDERWKMKTACIPVVKRATGEFHHFVSLTKAYRFKSRCCLAYQMPSLIPVPDYQASDDYFDIEFRPDQALYEAFATAVVRDYISAFDPYIAHSGPSDLAVEDFDVARTINKRKSIYRIFPIHYASESLVRSSFGLSCSGFVKKVAPHCDSAERFHDGVLVVTRDLLSIEESNAFSKAVLAALPAVKVHIAE